MPLSLASSSLSGLPPTLGSPVGVLMRPPVYVAPEDSLARAVEELRRWNAEVIAVADGEMTLVGVIGEREAARALAAGFEPSSPVSDAMRTPDTIPPYATGAEALRVIDGGAGPTLFVIDDQRRLLGSITASDLFPRKVARLRPPSVGGMATPFGVYLTNGVVRGGVGDLALVATGATLFVMLAVCQLAAYPVVDWISGWGGPEWLLTMLSGALPIALFMGLMRLAPLSGTHASEHMVVHAIERGEELDPNIIRRMPRVHPRCGTNLAVGAMLFLGIFTTELIENVELRFVLAAIVTFLLWRRLGSLVQLYVTTKPPKDTQIRSGLRAANELLDRYATSPISEASIPARLWRMGMLQVMAGSMLSFGALTLIAKAVLFLWQVELPF